MAALESLFWAKHAPNSEMIPLKIAKWIIAWEKNRFCWPCEGCQVSCRFFSFRPISSRTEWRHINTAWLPRQFQNGGLRSRFFRDEFLQDSRHFSGWNFGERKSWTFTCYRWRQKSRLFGVTLSFKRIRMRSERWHHRHFEFGKRTCLAVVSFKPSRTLARVCVISNYCAGSSILARVVCAWIHCNKGNKQ